MKKFLCVIFVLVFFLNAETLFQVKDSSNRVVLDVSTDGLRVLNEGDTVMVISSTEIKAVIDNSKALSRSFSVATSTSAKGQANVLEVTTGSTTMREGTAGNQYTDFSPENIFLGLNAGINTQFVSTTLGDNNIFLGNLSGITNTTGASNVFVGFKSGYSNLTGFKNCFVGQEAGYSNYSGRTNVFIGEKAGYYNYDGDFNVFVGNSAGERNTSGSRNIFIGNETGVANATGWGNTYVGEQCGYANIAGYGNSYFGRFVATSNEGNYNTCSGYESNTANQTGSYNSLYGAFSGKWNYSSGSSNSLFGYQAGFGTAVFTNTYNNNSYFGTQSGFSTTTGSNNSYFGYQSGYSNSSGSRNLFLGYMAGYNETGSDKLYIDNSSTANPLIYGDFDADWIKINGDFDVLNLATVGGLDVKGNAVVVGTFTSGRIITQTTSGNNFLRVTSPSASSPGIEFFRPGTGSYDWRIYNTGGNLRIGSSGDDLATVTDMVHIALSGNVGIGNTAPGVKLDITGGSGRVESGYGWLTNSDIRYKTNVSTLENALANVLKMRGVRYDLKDESDIDQNNGKHIGFIAQELEEVYPEFVVEDENNYKSVAYDKVNAVLVEAIKEQQSKIEHQERRIAKLEEAIEKLLK